MDVIIRKPTELNAPSSNAAVEGPKHLAFVTDAKAQEHIKAASATIEALSKNSDCGIIYFDEYGADYIKKVGRSFACLIVVSFLFERVMKMVDLYINNLPGVFFFFLFVCFYSQDLA
jgi:hypothetical protein